MKQKELIIIFIVIIIGILACFATYMIVNTHGETYTTLRISNSCTVQVPEDNISLENLNQSILRYSFDSHDLNITHQKSKNNSEINSIKNQLIGNSQKIEDNIYYDNNNNIYIAFIENNNTNDSVLITCSDLDMLKTILKSITFKNPENLSVDDSDDDSETNTITNSESNDAGVSDDTNYYKYYYYSKSNSSSNNEKTSANTPVQDDSNDEQNAVSQ